MPPAAIRGTRRAVPTHAVSPALVFPPWNPPFRGAPFQKEVHQGGKPIQGEAARLSCVTWRRPAQRTQPAPAEYSSRRSRSLLGWSTPLRRSANPPNPPGKSATQAALRALSCVSDFLLWGARSVCDRLVALHTAPDTPRNASGGKPYLPCPPPPSRPRPNRSCRSPSSQAVGENVTNNAPPWETANCRHRQPVLRGCAPSPYTDPQSRLPLSSPRRLSKTKPTTTLRTNRNASGGNLKIPPWGCRPPGGGPVALPRRRLARGGSPGREGRGSIPLPLITARARTSRRNPEPHSIGKPSP